MSAKKQLNLPGVEKVNMLEKYGRDKGSKVVDSTPFQNALKIIEHVKENGPLAPYEGYEVLNMEVAKKTDPDFFRMKTAFLSFVTKLKNTVKETGTHKELTVVARGGSRVFLGNMND